MKTDSVDKKWGCLIDNPQTVFRITIINPNNIIEYRLKDDKERYYASLSEINILDENDVPDDIKNAYNETEFLDL